MKILRLLVIVVLFASCSTNKVITDYDSKANFDSFKTFGFYKNVGENLSEFDINRVVDAIDDELTNRGFTFSETPDFFIDFKSKTMEDLNRNTIGIGVGSGGRNGGVGVSGGIPIGSKKLLEQITIDFVDTKEEQLFWQGSLKSKIKEKRKPEEKETYFKKVVTEILSNYPPK